MAGQTHHELEIEIGPDGETTVHVKGLKGKKCEGYLKVFENLLGKIKGQKRTTEYYEPDSPVTIDLHISGE
jgi:hypothetical protein